MKTMFNIIIVSLLIPSLVFAQIPRYRANESAVKQTDLMRVWAALNTEVGQQIVASIETTVGRIDFEHAQAFTTDEGDVAFVPLESFSNTLAALCYRQLNNGTEYIFLITFTVTEKALSLTFPSGQIFTIKSTGAEKSINHDFLFQEHDDLKNTVSVYPGLIRIIFSFLCFPTETIRIFLILFFAKTFPQCMSCGLSGDNCSSFCNVINLVLIVFILFLPFLFLVPAYFNQNSNLKMAGILFAFFYYGCTVLSGV